MSRSIADQVKVESVRALRYHHATSLSDDVRVACHRELLDRACSCGHPWAYHNKQAGGCASNCCGCSLVEPA